MRDSERSVKKFTTGPIRRNSEKKGPGPELSSYQAPVKEKQVEALSVKCVMNIETWFGQAATPSTLLTVSRRGTVRQLLCPKKF